MAVYAGTPVYVRGWNEKTAGAYFTVRVLQITLSSQGGATNYISAAALGFARIDCCSNLVKSDDSAAFSAVPSYDGSKLWVIHSDAPTDETGTFQVTIWGQPAPAIPAT